jgi:hypothetical protein
VQGASENFLLVDTVGSPGKLKVIHSVMICSSESVSVRPSTVSEASFCCALFCIFMAHVRYDLEQRDFIYDCYVEKTI